MKFRLDRLAAALCLAAAAAVQAQDAVRAPVGKPLAEVQELLKANKPAEALARLREVDAVPDKTPYEAFVIERLRGAAAAAAGDVETASRSSEAVLASGRLQPADRSNLLGSMAALFYRQKDYPKAADWAQRYLSEGGTNTQVRAVQLQSLYLAGRYADAARELQAEVAAETAAGRTPREDQLQMLASSQLRLKDEAGYAATLERMVASYPNAERWADLIDRVQRRPGFAERLALDAFRLKRATSGLQEAAEFMEMAQLSMEAGYPVEASAVMEEGFKSGLLGKGGDTARQQALRERAAAAAAKDAATLGQVAPGADGNALAGTGLELVLAGQAARGAALIEQGIVKGALKQPDHMQLRLGMAWVLAGQRAKAEQALKAVRGNDGATDLARLWLLRSQRLAS